MFLCPVRLHLQSSDSKIKLLRIARQWPWGIKPKLCDGATDTPVKPILVPEMQGLLP